MFVDAEAASQVAVVPSVFKNLPAEPDCVGRESTSPKVKAPEPSVYNACPEVPSVTARSAIVMVSSNI